MAALAYALDPSSLVTPVGPEGSATMEALADGLDEVRTAAALRDLLGCWYAIAVLLLARDCCCGAIDT